MKSATAGFGFRVLGLSLTAACLTFAATASAEECHDSAVRIASAAPSIAFVERYEAGDHSSSVEVRFSHEHNGNVIVRCTGASGVTIVVDTTATPPAWNFYMLAATVAAAEVGIRPDHVLNTMRRCMRQVLHDGGLRSEVKLRRSVTRCAVDARNRVVTTRMEFTRLDTEHY